MKFAVLGALHHCFQPRNAIFHHAALTTFTHKEFDDLPRFFGMGAGAQNRPSIGSHLHTADAGVGIDANQLRLDEAAIAKKKQSRYTMRDAK